MAASVGLAEPVNKKRWGYLSEYHSFGETEKEAGDYAEDIAAQMLASSLGIPFDVDKNWDEKRNQWKVSKQIYRTRNITQSAVGDQKERWTTVFAAAVLIL
jgi:arginine decarboxylase